LSERYDDLAALRRAFAALPAVPPDPAACPPSERLLAAVAGELPPAELRDLVEHVAACPACAEDWRLAAALEKPAGEAPEAAYSPVERIELPPIRHAKAWWTAAAAAVVLLAVGLLPWLHDNRLHDERSALRGGQAKPAFQVPDVLPRESCVLRWTAVAGATYDVEVYTLHDDILDRVTGLTETRYQVPPARLAKIPAATVLYCQLTVHRPGGGRAAFARQFVLR
jgi:hypothetical protein